MIKGIQHFSFTVSNLDEAQYCPVIFLEKSAILDEAFLVQEKNTAIALGGTARDGALE